MQKKPKQIISCDCSSMSTGNDKNIFSFQFQPTLYAFMKILSYPNRRLPWQRNLVITWFKLDSKKGNQTNKLFFMPSQAWKISSQYLCLQGTAAMTDSFWFILVTDHHNLIFCLRFLQVSSVLESRMDFKNTATVYKKQATPKPSHTELIIKYYPRICDRPPL